MEIPLGEVPTPIVFITVFENELITETLLLPELVTYTWVPSGVTLKLTGKVPTATVASTVFVLVLMTDILFEVKLAT